MEKFNLGDIKTNLTWLKDRTIYLSIHGSHAYGTNIEGSDLDIRGVAIAPKEYYIGLTNGFEQFENKEPDLVIFELRKFMRLATECNPNALEILFTEDCDHLFENELGRMLIDNRDLFLSKKAKFTFSGYAHSQLKRIKSHKSWILSPILKQPERKDFGLPERTVIPADQLAAARAAIEKKVDEWSWKDMEQFDPGIRQFIKTEFTERLIDITSWAEDSIRDKIWFAAANSLGFSTNFLEILDKERNYQNRLNDWRNYNTWKTNRNPARAAMEEKYHYDTKHLMHIVRLTRTCKELLSTGKLIVKRPDAQELIDIRNGAWTYEMAMEWFDKEIADIESLYETSKLPHSCDINKISNLAVSIIEKSL